jgi:hypothetical protein
LGAGARSDHERQQVAHDTVGKLIEITRANAAARLGTACFPG